MKNKSIIVVIFCLGLALTAYNNNNKNKSYAKSTSDNVMQKKYRTTEFKKNHPVNLSDQNVNTMIIVEVLRNYSAERMEQAISQTFDAQVFIEKSLFQTYLELTDLINDLRSAELIGFLEEDLGFTSLQFKKDDQEFKLNIYFAEFSQKILKMEYSKLD